MTEAPLKTFIADLARPYTFYSLATASCIAIVKIGWEITDGYQGAAFMGVVLAGASAIYIGKSFEQTRIAGHNAEVEKVRAAQSSPPPAQALAPATALGDGELPPDQQVKL